MTNDEVMEELRSNSALNAARAKFSSWYGQIEQSGLQRKPLGPIEIRGLEFEAVKEIIETYNKPVRDIISGEISADNRFGSFSRLILLEKIISGKKYAVVNINTQGYEKILNSKVGDFISLEIEYKLGPEALIIKTIC